MGIELSKISHSLFIPSFHSKNTATIHMQSFSDEVNTATSVLHWKNMDLQFSRGFISNAMAPSCLGSNFLIIPIK